MVRAMTSGAIDCFSVVCSGVEIGAVDRGAERRHDPLLLEQLVLEVGSGETGEFEVQAMGSHRTVGGVRRRSARPARSRSAAMPASTVRCCVSTINGEVGGVELDERLDEVVLVMVVEFEQVDRVGALCGDVGDRVEVGDVERAGVHRGVEHRVADGLVDLAVEVVGQHARR